MKRIIVESYRRRMEMKKLHQRRKTVSMLSVCRRWLRTTSWLRINDFARRKLDVPKTAAGFRKLLRLAFEDFSTWRCEERAMAWGLQFHETHRAGGPQHPRDDEDLRTQKRRGFQGPEGPDFKRIKVNSVTSAKGDAFYDRAVGAQVTTNTADWWDFDVALAAGRRWRQIVKDRKKRLTEVGWATINAEHQAKKAAEFAAFEKWRRSEGKWWSRVADRWVQLEESTLSPEITTESGSASSTGQAIIPMDLPIFLFADDQVRPSWKRPQSIGRLSQEEGKPTTGTYKKSFAIVSEKTCIGHGRWLGIVMFTA
jgi:hypothetical protein